MLAMPRLHLIDLEYLGQPGCIAAHVIETDEGLILVESGPGSTVDVLQRGLADLGRSLADVRHLLVTHIHFDHAGAAGHVAEAGATVHVHEFGAKHLVDPSRLLASATRIYGDDMDRLWGELRPIPAARVSPTRDGDVVELGGVRLRAIETPGHARHHHAFATELHGERICFTGDAAGALCLDAPTFVSLPAPPPEFDPEAWLDSIERLRAERFDAIFPTHFGRMDDVDAHLARVAEAVRAHADRVKAWLDEGRDEATIRDAYGTWFLEQADAHGLPEPKRAFYAKGSVVDMNVTGILRYWRKRTEAEAAAADEPGTASTGEAGGRPVDAGGAGGAPAHDAAGANDDAASASRPHPAATRSD